MEIISKISKGTKMDQIYIPKNSDCDSKWWDIAVRIEDDILIKKNGFEILNNLGKELVII